MPRRRTRLTRRGTAALAVLAVVSVGVVAAVTRSWGADCTVTAADREVSLDRTDAEASSRAVADVVRRSGTANQATAAVLGEIDLDVADAAVIGNALSGRTRSALVCRYGGARDGEEDRLGATGLTHRAEAVRDDVQTRFGKLPLGGFAPGGVSDGHMPGSAHYDGRAVDIFFRPVNAANKQHGWAVAQYLVANAERLKVNTVIFDAKIWTSRRSGSGWRDYTVDRGARSAATVKILEHRDHVHVDVAD
ncbi:MAG: hypothetical protein NTV23_10585 [Propionibacteriales bacterium]|nr:hypothetical protein [Propionibacteriales bacterium]